MTRRPTIIRLFDVEARVLNVVWTCDDANIKRIIKIASQNRDLYEPTVPDRNRLLAERVVARLGAEPVHGNPVEFDPNVWY